MSELEKIEPEKVSSIREFPKNTDNPFLDELVIQKKNTVVGIGKKRIMIDEDTGEVSDESSRLVISKKVDKDSFIKIYKAKLQILFDLTPEALKVLSYFMNKTPIGKDLIMFDVEECMEFLGYKSNKSVFNGLLGLLNAKFIARANTSSLYFINPAIFFNGDRLTIVEHYEKKKVNNQINNSLTHKKLNT